MNAPMVSIVIPTCNAQETIAEALASVWGQTFSDFEIIIVDDASSDGTISTVRSELTNQRIDESPNPRLPAVLSAGARSAEEEARSAKEGIHESTPVRRSFSEGGSHRIIVLSQNRGPAAARNAGIEAATGEWIAFLDGDDTWLPWRLEVQLQAVRDAEGVGLVCGRTVELGDEVTAPSAERVKATRLTLRDFAVRNKVATSTVLVRREELIAAGRFDEQFRGPEDYDLWIRIAARTGVLKLDAPLARYRDVRGSLSRDDRTFLPQVLRVLQKAYGSGGALDGVPARRRAQAYQYLCAAWMAAERGARGRACRLFLASFARWPFSFKPYLNAPWCRVKLMAGILRRFRQGEP